MIKQKTIYITRDGMRFDIKKNAERYDEDYTRLKYIYDTYLGEPLPYPGIGEGPCLETRQHTKEGINQCIVELINTVNMHCILYVKDYDLNNSEFTDILNLYTELQKATEENEIRKIFDRIIWKLSRFILSYYFDNNEKYFNNHYQSSIIHIIYNRLKNTSYISGKEYPDNAYCGTWVNREDKWDEYVESEKKYQDEGGLYR